MKSGFYFLCVICSIYVKLRWTRYIFSSLSKLKFITVSYIIFIIFYNGSMWTFFDPFLASVLILYPLKTPESQKFSVVFRGYKMEALVLNGLTTYENPSRQLHGNESSQVSFLSRRHKTRQLFLHVSVTSITGNCQYPHVPLWWVSCMQKGCVKPVLDFWTVLPLQIYMLFLW